MPKASLILVMATLSEAKPFIEGLCLVQKEGTPFPVFTGDGRVLLVCGIGKVNAAMGTAYACLKLDPSVIVNLGAAGATDHNSSLGDIFHINRIYEFDRPALRTGKPCLTETDTLPGFKPAAIATQDRPVLLPDDRREIARLAGLIDMEAAGIAQTCRKFSVKCLIFKFVSDTPEHIEGNDIVANIKKYRTPFYAFFIRYIFPLLSDPDALSLNFKNL
jgi:adenosylhomocysteine nucleosidase